jgi:hypothetical protein
MRELKLIASCSHPSVVQFKDYGWFEGRLWFAMPWYKGQTLDQRYAGFPMTRAEARPIFERLAMGLAAMHEVGIEHHDIKPENIFLADIAGFEGGLPVLLDLGIAGEHGEGPRGLTLDYAAPETAARALGEEVNVGTAADVFSLALVLRNMLEPREEPDGAFEPIAILHQRATQPVEGFRHRGFRFMQPYMERWLSSDPYERPTAQELAEELAILTEPEEKRAARMRLLKRLLPVVAVAALLVAVLWNQVREQKTQLTHQQELLSEQQQEAAVLRERTADQLGQLENQMAELGTQRRELQRAIGIARELDGRLEETERQREQLRRRARTLTTERDGLQKDMDRLNGELASLEQRRAALERERDGLATQRDGLTRERDGLARERDGLTRERDRLEQRVGSLSTAVEAAKQRLTSVEAERDEVRQEQTVLQKEASALRKQRDALERDKAQLEKDKAQLERDKARLETRMKAYEKRFERLRERSVGAGAAEPDTAEP